MKTRLSTAWLGAWPAIALPVLLMIVVPAHVVSMNIDSLGMVSPLAFFPYLLLGITSSAVLLLTVRALRRLNSERVLLWFLEFGSYFVVCTGLLLPLAASPGMQEVGALAVDRGNLGLSVLLAGTVFFLARKHSRARLPTVVLLFAGLNLIWALAVVLTSYLKHPSPSEFASLSREQNILVFSLDGVSGSAARHVLRNDPELSAHFQGFEIFSNTASSSPATAASTFTSLRGNRNYKLEFQTEERLWDSAPEELLTNTLLRRGWSVSAFGVYARKLAEQGKAWSSAPASSDTMLHFLNLSLARTVSPLYALRGNAYEYADRYFKKTWLLSGSERKQPTFQHAVAPDWKQLHNEDLAAMGTYLQSLNAESAQPAAHFLHFTHTHYPVEYDESCRHRATDEQWYSTNQNWEGNLKQTTCALKQYILLIERLKRLDIFENSTVVLKSDHGRPRAYYQSEQIHSFAINEHELWGVGRYEPFLAVKPMGPARRPLAWRNEPVMLDDLALTLCNAAEAKADCAQYTGFDLFALELRGITQDQVSVFIVKSPASDFRYDTHSAVTFNRGSNVVQSLLAKIVDDSLTEELECGSSVRVEDFPRWNNGHTDGKSWVIWRDEESLFVRLRAQSGCEILELSLLGRNAGTNEMTIRVNDNQVPFNWRKAVDGLVVWVPVGESSASVEVQIELLAMNNGTTYDIVEFKLGASASTRDGTNSALGLAFLDR